MIVFVKRNVAKIVIKVNVAKKIVIVVKKTNAVNKTVGALE